MLKQTHLSWTGDMSNGFFWLRVAVYNGGIREICVTNFKPIKNSAGIG